MIEGLKVTITGNKLRELCLKHADHCDERAKVYADQKRNLEANQIEGMTYSGGDPHRALNDKREEHAAHAQELRFIAEHIDVSEDYMLDRGDLSRIGVVRSRF